MIPDLFSSALVNDRLLIEWNILVTLLSFHVGQCAWSHWTVDDYRWEHLFTMFWYFAPVTRHSFQAMCTVFSRKDFSDLFDGLLRISTRKTNAEPRCLTSPWWSHLGSETSPIGPQHHLANPYTGFKITAKAVGKNSGSCFSVKNKFAHAIKWSMSAKFGIFVFF